MSKLDDRGLNPADSGFVFGVRRPDHKGRTSFHKYEREALGRVEWWRDQGERAVVVRYRISDAVTIEEGVSDEFR